MNIIVVVAWVNPFFSNDNVNNFAYLGLGLLLMVRTSSKQSRLIRDSIEQVY